MSRDEVLDYVFDNYGVAEQYLWLSAPSYAVLRHEDNQKWFAIIMDIDLHLLDPSRQGKVDILDIKCDPKQIDQLVSQRGFFRGYHMNKTNWLTVLLDGTVPAEKVKMLIDQSFDLTSSKVKGKKS